MRKTDDQVEVARSRDLVSLLTEMGFVAHKNKKESMRAVFHSPFRKEENPSFYVNKKRNKWVDFGETGKGGALRGDIIDFVMRYNKCSFSEAVGFLVSGNHAGFAKPNKNVVYKESGIDVISVGDIKNAALLRYANERGISNKVLRRYCKEVHFSFKGNAGTTNACIGFQNDKGGWELRNSKHKVGNSPKYWSSIRGLSSQQAFVFEGFFDFLSYMELIGLENPPYDAFVLNTLVFADFIKPELEKYRCVYLYLDNDEAGDRFIEEKFKEPRYIDVRPSYLGYSDFNDFLIGNKQKQHGKLL